MIGHIKGIGLEVEGPWRDAVQVKDHVSGFKEEWFDYKSENPEVKYYMECVSDILKYPKHIDEFFEQIAKQYMEKDVQFGMGFHIHFSFAKKEHYELIFSKHFINNFFNDLFNHFKADEQLKSRVNYRSKSGTNFYKIDYDDDYFNHRIDKKKHDTDKQERYYFINFWRAYGDHETFEIRILPATTIPKMKEYLAYVVAYINDYIDEHIGEEEIEIISDCIVTSEENTISNVKSNDSEEIELR